MFIYLSAILILAAFLGYYVVWRVSPSLHAPLMSVTNAISGLTVLGALKIAGNTTNPLILGVSLLAVFLAAVNLMGGFVISERMLELFKKKENKDD